MPAKRCIETKNMCLLFVDYCKVSLYTQEEKYDWVWRRQKLGKYPQKEKKAPTIIVSAFLS